MVDACERYGLKFNLGTQRRYTPGYLKMREIVESGEIGERHSVIAYSGGSALWGYTHAADMLLFLASDSEVEYVQGNVAVDDADFDDNRTDADPPIVMGYVRFKNGVHGVSIPGSAYEFEVDCSRRHRTLVKQRERLSTAKTERRIQRDCGRCIPTL